MRLAKAAGAEPDKPFAKAKITLQAFRRLLADNDVRYTEAGLENLPRYAGTDLRKAGAKPMSVEALVSAMSKVPEVPLYMTLLPPEQAARSPASKWQAGLRKFKAASMVAGGMAGAPSPGGAPGGAGPSTTTI